VDALQTGLRSKGYNLGTTQSPVTPVFLNGTEYEAGNLILDIREKYNIFCSMVIYPIVPKNIIMLRIIPTAVHSLSDVEETIAAFDAVRDNLKSGKYRKEGIFNFAE
jgi:glycine C-acetyltransferase